jgi:hypothetical protein
VQSRRELQAVVAVGWSVARNRAPDAHRHPSCIAHPSSLMHHASLMHRASCVPHASCIPHPSYIMHHASCIPHASYIPNGLLPAGSGLSRRSLVSPRVVADVLHAAHHHLRLLLLPDLLPRAGGRGASPPPCGHQGTLSGRLVHCPCVVQVRLLPGAPPSVDAGGSPVSPPIWHWSPLAAAVPCGV